MVIQCRLKEMGALRPAKFFGVLFEFKPFFKVWDFENRFYLVLNLFLRVFYACLWF